MDCGAGRADFVLRHQGPDRPPQRNPHSIRPHAPRDEDMDKRLSTRNKGHPPRVAAESSTHRDKPTGFHKPPPRIEA